MKRPAARGQSRARAIWGTKLGAVVTLAAFALAGCADMPVFHTPAEVAGFATTPKEGADFVKETHPDKTEFTSVGVETAKQDQKPRDAKGVKQLQAELEAQRDAGHAILQKLSPPQAAAPQTDDERLKARIASKQKQKEDAAKKAKDQGKGQAKDKQQDAAQPTQ
jgi:hypothetical protein